MKSNIMNAIQELTKSVNGTNQRLDKIDNRLDSIETDIVLADHDNKLQEITSTLKTVENACIVVW